VLPRLLEVDALAGAVEGHFALLAAALRTNAPVDRGTESLLLALFADGAAQMGLLKSLWHGKTALAAMGASTLR